MIFTAWAWECSQLPGTQRSLVTWSSHHGLLSSKHKISLSISTQLPLHNSRKHKCRNLILISTGYFFVFRPYLFVHQSLFFILTGKVSCLKYSSEFSRELHQAGITTSWCLSVDNWQFEARRRNFTINQATTAQQQQQVYSGHPPRLGASSMFIDLWTFAFIGARNYKLNALKLI